MRVPSRGRCQRRRSGPGRLGTAQRESEARRCEQNQTASTVGANVGRWREGFSSLTGPAVGTGRGTDLQRARGEPARAQPHRLGLAEQEPLRLAIFDAEGVVPARVAHPDGRLAGLVVVGVDGLLAVLVREVADVGSRRVPVHVGRLPAAAVWWLDTVKSGSRILLACSRPSPGNGAPIGGLQVATADRWVAPPPPGTEGGYKNYAQSVVGRGHPARGPGPAGAPA